MKPNFSKGLLPAVVIEEGTKEVLMLAYMNEEAYEKTLKTKRTWFYSRSRRSLWNKGETSGHVQHVQSLYLDCDQDAIVVFVKQVGPACHTGEKRVFITKLYRGIHMENTFKLLFETIEERKRNPLPESYTNYLFSKGEDKILKKIGEECTEVIIASKNNDKEELVKEMVDVLYHCFVLLAEKNIPLEDIMEEVTERNGKLSRVGDRREIDTL